MRLLCAQFTDKSATPDAGTLCLQDGNDEAFRLRKDLLKNLSVLRTLAISTFQNLTTKVRLDEPHESTM